MKSARPSRLAGIASEVTTKGYFARAQQRATRRKSPWNLLDLLAGLSCMGLVWWAFVHAVWLARNLLIPQHSVPFATVFHSQRTSLALIVFFVAPFFAAISVGFLLSNYIVWCIPAYRRAIEPEAKNVWHASFSDAQKDLSLLALCIGCPSILASFVAALVIR